MSPRWEISGERDLAINNWHRMAFEDDCFAFDLDLCGVCRSCYETLYLIESTRAEFKSTRWITTLAEQMNPSPPPFLIKYANNDDGHLVEFDAWLLLTNNRREHLDGGRRELEETLTNLRQSHQRTCRRKFQLREAA
jgi:hypothetical protein